ncbi:aliphatic sulfonate ABC transporter substrate-binding protein [Treponema primitia]|uniref:ABC transporter substrate-binding protein n=1 Tax=Treponema primitia TaxID=88058 RepID=UPI0039803C4D
MKKFYGFTSGLKGYILFAVIALFGSVQIFAGGGAQSTAPAAVPGGKEQPVKIRLASTVTSQTHARIAEKLGYFTDEGLDVDFTVFAYGPPEIEAFTAGSLDIGTVGDLPSYSAIANGVDLVIVGFYSTSDTITGILVRDAANIKSFADLKGKKVAVAFGSNNHPLLYQYLDLGGVKESDVEIFNLPLSEQVSALVTGRIDAVVTSEPRITQAVQAGGITLLSDTKGIRVFSNPVIAHTAFLKTYPEQAAKLLRALDKAGRWANANADEAGQLIADITGGSKESQVLAITKAQLDFTLTKERVDNFVLGAELSHKYGLIPEKIDVRSHVDDSFLKAAGVQ